jgi:hypothetical protein
MVFGRGRPAKATMGEPTQNPVQQIQQPQQIPMNRLPDLPPQTRPVIPTQQKIWSVEEVVTQTENIIKNQLTGETWSVLDAIVELLNRTEEQ